MQSPMAVLKSFLSRDFEQRDSIGAVDCLAHDIQWFGTGANEDVRTYEEAVDYIEDEMSKDSSPYQVEIISEHEHVIADGIGIAHVKTLISSAGVTIECRISATTCIDDGKTRICSLHFSVPDATQDNDEYFPFSREERYAHDLMRDYFDTTVSCGIQGGYCESGFPLYFANGTLLATLGYEDERHYIDAIDGLVANGIHPDDRAAVTHAVNEQLDRDGKYQVVYRMLKSDGSYLWVDDRGKRIVADNGKDAIISVCFDMTDQHEEARELTQDRDMLLAAAKVMFPMVIAVNLTRNSFYMIEYERFNTRKAEEQGVFDELVRTGASTIHVDERDAFVNLFSRQSLLAAHAQGKNTVALTHRQKGDDGQWHWNRTTVVFVEDRFGDDVLELTLTECVDDEKAIETALAENEQALAKALMEAKKANEAKTVFLSRMSHEMRTPMNVILGLATIATDEADDPAATRASLDKINDAGQLLLQQINDVLDMTKIESAVLELHPEPYEQKDMLQQLKLLIEPLARQKGITLTITEASPQFPAILTDKVRYRQILFNLLSSAIKSTPKGGKVECLAAITNRTSDSLSTRVTIRDNGIGLSPERLEHVFEPFSRNENRLSKQENETDLGLALVKKLVDLMGGSISVESELGRGTTFSIDMTFDIADSAKTAVDDRTVDLAPLAGKRILLCEDHPVNAEITIRLLERAGVAVSHADNGQAGVTDFAQSPAGSYDAILMDIRMPIMDGLAATRAIRALDRDDAHTVPIIAMTANAFDDDRQRSKDAGMNDHLAKPIEPSLLYRTLIRHMEAAETE